ncbi:uncharacterized protein [Leptinotarsa decemlineata]|uniref:uncharacterized protein n=1 Tax=Leptinotarsa decemlineata TaxID=7539 RepID=UPI003D3048C1
MTSRASKILSMVTMNQGKGLGDNIIGPESMSTRLYHNEFRSELDNFSESESTHREFPEVSVENKQKRDHQMISLMPCYPRGHPITEVKYNDLMSLFSMNPPALSRDYFDFHYNLPHRRTDEEEED